MIEILEASHGGSSSLDYQLSDFESLDQLVAHASSKTSVPPENVLLFLEDGRELKDEVLQEIYERGGEGGQSQPRIQQLFLFNRATFYAESPEAWALQYEEALTLPPPLNLSAISDLGQAQEPFILASDHLQHLLSLFYAQARALAIGYTSLASHLEPLLREFDEFQVRAKAQLEVEDRLIRSSAADMAMLSRTVVHDAFNKKKDRRDSMEGADGVRTMATYVNPVKMQQVRESCQVAHEAHIRQFDKLARQIEDLALQSETERKASEDRAQQVAVEFEQGIQRFELATTQLELLFQNDSQTLSQDLMELDAAMREDLSILTNVKNDYTLDLHIHLRQVADFQIRIAELVTPIQDLDTNLKSQAAFPHLQRLHLLPVAYAATVIEVVRRKEFAIALKAWTDRLSTTLAKFAEGEGSRRREIRTEVTSQLPFVVPALDDLPPKFELTVNTGSEGLSALAVTKADVEGLMKWIQALKNDGELQGTIIDQESDPIPFLELGIEDAIAKMDEASLDLDQMIERSVLLHRSRHGDNTQEIQSRLGVVTDENAVLRQQLADGQKEYQARLGQIEETHGHRNRSLQIRQGELQDELVRLRTDLEEEMLARQAMATELSERVMEQERDQLDHADMIAGLQAELVQEKSRATDLGVRLQEALLDVDGLKSAEISTQSHIQSLQDERSKLLQSVSDAQNGSRQLESQLAGMRAELEATTAQLGQARTERDAALKNQSAEAERLMRDHIAEADGDRAVLEHQNLTLSKQVEDVRVEMEQKMTAAKNAAVRTADGLKAELSFTKAQLRDVQRRETILADDLAMAKDTAQSMNQKDAHQSDVARDAVALVTKYHDACHRILSTITASSTISASTHIVRPKSPSPPPAVLPSDKPLQDSILGRSLATAGAFDLEIFADAVNKTISLVKKLNKSCRYYRDHAKNKISFTAFAKGDLALFLPTRNATTRPWMAYNVSVPHHFLKVPTDKVELWKARDSIIARIVGTEEAIAGDTPTTNPFGLAEGLRFYIHQVEEFMPSAPIRAPRRSASTTYGGPPPESMTSLSEFAARPSAIEPRLDGILSPTVERRDYFPPSPAPISETPQAMSPDMAIVDGAGSSKAQPSGGSELAPIAVPKSPTEKLSDLAQPMIASPTSTEPPKLSPVFETPLSPPSISTPAPPPAARPAPPFAFRPPASTISPLTAPRPVSRPAGMTPLKRETGTGLGGPSFTPGSFGRSPSVASSGGSYTQPSIMTGAAKSALAPAMAVAASSEYRRSGSSNSNHSYTQVNGHPGDMSCGTRRPSSELRRPNLTYPAAGAASSSVNRVPSSATLFTFDDLGQRSSPEVPSPLSRQISRRMSGNAGIRQAGSSPRSGSGSGPGGVTFPSGGSAGMRVGASPPVVASSENGSLGLGAGSNFWTLGRKRLGSMVSKDEDPKGKGKEKVEATAEDLLKRFDNH